jgi:hypothetical protein
VADRDAYAAAERLVREASARAEEAAREPPPRGWQAAGHERPSPFPDLTLVTGLLEAAHGAVPPELARQLADAVRELLVAVRALLDYSIARLERPQPDEPVVEDIPID